LNDWEQSLKLSGGPNEPPPFLFEPKLPEPSPAPSPLPSPQVDIPTRELFGEN